jgi:hypothetical protein
MLWRAEAGTQDRGAPAERRYGNPPAQMSDGQRSGDARALEVSHISVLIAIPVREARAAVAGK